MMIKLLDDYAYCGRFVVAHLGLWRKHVGYYCSRHHITFLKYALLTLSQISNRLTAMFGVMREAGGCGWVNSFAFPWVPISYTLTHNVYL